MPNVSVRETQPMEKNQIPGQAKEPLSLNVRQGPEDIASQENKGNGMVRKEVETWMEEISNGCTSCVSKTHPFA